MPVILISLSCKNDATPELKYDSNKTTLIIISEVEHPDTFFISVRPLVMTPKVTFFENDIVVKKEYSKKSLDTFLIDASATEFISISYGNTIMYEIPVIANDTLKIVINNKRATGNYVNNDMGVDKIFWFVNNYNPLELMNMNYDLFFEKIARKFFLEKQNNFNDVYHEEKNHYLSLISKLNSLVEDKIISLQIKNLLMINLQSRMANIMTINHIKKIVNQDTSMSFLTKPFLGMEDKPLQDSYLDFCKNYLITQLSEKIKTGPFHVTNFPKLFDQTSEQINLNKQLRARLLLWEMENIFEYFPEDIIKTYFDKYKKLASQKQIEYLKKSNIWLNYNNEGDEISVFDLAGQKTYLQERLNSDKIKYIDFWASWCGPCIAEMAYSKKLEKSFQSQVDFIYISIDKNFSHWTDAIEKIGISTGEHNFLIPTTTNGVNFMGQNIREIPRYIIVDRKGQVFHKNAPRPSDPNLPAILKRLIKEKN